MAGVQFIGVDQHQRAAAREVFGTAIAVTLGAGHDHADHIAVMHMRGEAMLDVARRQQLDPGQRRGLPEADRLALIAHAGTRASHCGMRRSR
ncbi:hypothetical protein D1872_317390 [compost metagenome]